MCKLVSYIKENFPKALHSDTMATLGDRSQYIGASDIGGCLRKAYESKTNPSQHDLATLIRFERGHVAETVVAKMLTGLNFDQQYEAVGELDGFPLKAHIDFLIKGNNPAIIEVKSVSAPIDKPYDSWILQTQLQLGLCRSEYQIDRGYVLAIDLNTGWLDAFPVKFNEYMLMAALDRTKILIEAIRTGVAPEAEEQFYCSDCEFKMDCPALLRGETIELPEDIKAAVKQLSMIAELKKEEKQLKKEIEAFIVAANAKSGIADNNVVQLQYRKGRKTFDENAFAAAHPEINMDDFMKVGDPYSFIKIA